MDWRLVGKYIFDLCSGSIMPLYSTTSTMRGILCSRRDDDDKWNSRSIAVVLLKY